MTAIRDARADAIRRRHRDTGDDLGRLGGPPGRALALLLDDLDAIDRAHPAAEVPAAVPEVPVITAGPEARPEPPPRRRTR